MMFGKDQAEKLRVLAGRQDAGAQEEAPLTYSSLIGKSSAESLRAGRASRLRGIAIILTGTAILAIVMLVVFLSWQNSIRYKTIINSLNRESRGLKEEFASVLEKTRDLEQRLTANLKKNQELSEQLQDFEQTNSSLNDQLSVLARERKLLLDQISEARENTDKIARERQALRQQLEESVNGTQEQISGLQDKIAELSLKLEESASVIGSIQASGAEAAAYPKILLINKDALFVLVSAGQENGYMKGMRLLVMNNGAAVGELEIIEARARVSACDIKTSPDNLKLGDEVKIR